MDEDSVCPGDQGSPGLDELVEPLADSFLPEPLPADTILSSPEGASFRIVRLLKADPPIRLYEAVLTGDPRPLWLREAVAETAVSCLRQEARVLEGLEGPMFPQVLACFESAGQTYLITDAHSDCLLSEALAAGSLELSQVLRILAQIAFALKQLHARGWVHLGLRPNIIGLGKPVKILDFSYATRLGQKPSTPFYHAGYSPPELLTDEPVDARADVYAVGALLFHALQGQPIAETGAELSAWELPLPIAGIPQILHRCLGSPETRYPTMEELHADLRQLLQRLEPRISYRLAAATTIGLEPTRITNQDAHAYLTGRMESEAGPGAWAVICVADGMGGMAAGEVASAIAAKTMLSEAGTALTTRHPVAAEEQARWVKEWVHTANERVCAALEERQARGGTTLVCACVVNRRLSLAHVGDCRLYLLRNGQVSLLTRDHSLAMALALQGEVPLEEVRYHPDRSQVTRSLGDRQPLPDYFVDTLQQTTGNPTMELQVGDVLLLCSDGLWEPVREEEMLQAMQEHTSDLNAATEALLTLALQRGAPDNATVALLQVVQEREERTVWIPLRNDSATDRQSVCCQEVGDTAGDFSEGAVAERNAS